MELCQARYWTVQVPRTLYFNCYLDRRLLLSNCIGPKARDLTSWGELVVREGH